ncbi:MAG: hypothetical protein JWP93_267 [Polaromonas sp.]|nr:hypothetical protein [Polaromonas sp.]
MSGSSIAYHLRQNKAIERNLFIELLARVGRVRNISDYEYIGFGGPLLEDYKALHAALRMTRMHSIECDENTYERQKFNCPASFVTLHHSESGDFIRQHQYHDQGTIAWLDYTRPSDLSQQLQEFRQVVSNLDSYDVAKITLNADPTGLGCENEKAHERPAKRAQVLKDRIPEYVPVDLTAASVTSKSYAHTLQKCVQISLADLPARAGGRYFHILSSFAYKDGQQMLTVTGMVFEAKDDPKLHDFLHQSRIEHWPFANLTWAAPTQISVPALSAKERMILDQCLPLRLPSTETPTETLKKTLGYIPGDEKDESELANYARYYRAYPHFSRVIL